METQVRGKPLPRHRYAARNNDNDLEGRSAIVPLTSDSYVYDLGYWFAPQLHRLL